MPSGLQSKQAIEVSVRPSPPYNERLRIQGSQSFFAVYKIVSVQKNTSALALHNRLMQSVLKIRRL